MYVYFDCVLLGIFVCFAFGGGILDKNIEEKLKSTVISRCGLKLLSIKRIIKSTIEKSCPSDLQL
jgi:hypothetical protein